MSGGVEGVALLPMSEAPKDGTCIIGYYQSLDSERTKHWDGRAFVIRHEGQTVSDYDLGWGLFPGWGGVPDIHFTGWSPLPSALTTPPARTYAEGVTELPGNSGQLLSTVAVREAIEAAAKIADDLASIAQRGKNHPQPLSIDTNEAWRRVEGACLDISSAIRLLPQGADK